MSNFDVQIRLQSEVVNPIGGLTYGVVVVRRWTDDTGNIALSQFDRLNLQLGATPRYYLLQASAAQLLLGASVQFACLIDSAVVPDAGLGGELFFAAAKLEQPVGAVPGDIQEAAVSAVHNLTVYAPGHYCWQLQRDQHGSKIVHLDVEATP